jgi:hypothetical protein
MTVWQKATKKSENDAEEIGRGAQGGNEQTPQRPALALSHNDRHRAAEAAEEQGGADENPRRCRVHAARHRRIGAVDQAEQQQHQRREYGPKDQGSPLTQIFGENPPRDRGRLLQNERETGWGHFGISRLSEAALGLSARRGATLRLQESSCRELIQIMRPAACRPRFKEPRAALAAFRFGRPAKARAAMQTSAPAKFALSKRGPQIFRRLCGHRTIVRRLAARVSPV